MAKSFWTMLFISLICFVVFISTASFIAEARPLTTGTTSSNAPPSPDEEENGIGSKFLGYWVSLVDVKDDPVWGVGHKYTNVEILGRIKVSGPSRGDGNKVVTATAAGTHP